MTLQERTQYTIFLIHAFQSLENDLLRPCALRLVSLPLWSRVSSGMVERQLRQYPQLRRHWAHFQKTRSDGERGGKTEEGEGVGEDDAAARAPSAKRARTGRSAKKDTSRGTAGTSTASLQARMEEGFLADLLDHFFGVLATIPASGDADAAAIRFCERFVEFAVDLLTQLPTRFVCACCCRCLRAASFSCLLAGTCAVPCCHVHGVCPLPPPPPPPPRVCGVLSFPFVLPSMPCGACHAHRFVCCTPSVPSRSRFFRTLVLDKRFAIICRSCGLRERGEEANLFNQLVDMFEFYEGFEVDDQTGMSLTSEQVDAKQYAALQVMQRVAFKYYGDKLRDFALAAVGTVRSREALSKHLSGLDTPTLRSMAERLQLVTPSPDGGSAADLQRGVLLEVLLRAHAPRTSQVAAINAMPLYPNEELLWDPHQVPSAHTTGTDAVLALPKLNLQFLTFHDYLLRSFKLFRLESAYEIREDIVDAVKRLQPRCVTGFVNGEEVQETSFDGWARMATPVSGFSVTQVRKPNVGEEVPAAVKGEVRFNLSRYNGAVRREWDALREHDVVFLLTIRMPAKAQDDDDDEDSTGEEAAAEQANDELSFAKRFGIVCVRGGEVYAIEDEAGNPMNDPFAQRDGSAPAAPVGSKRKIRLRLDAAQYHADLARTASGGADMYETFNVLLRRKPKENNFKAVLETIRDVMNVAAVGKAVPEWLHDIFLGYGDAGAANFRALPHHISSLDFKDTFVSGAHAVASFPNSAVVLQDADGNVVKDKDAAAKLAGPFRAEFATKTNATTNAKPAEEPQKQKRRKRGRGGKTKTGKTKGGAQASSVANGDASPTLVNDHLPAATANEVVTLRAYRNNAIVPYPRLAPPQNKVPFTPVQVEAIRSGMNPGLTMVVGPPGTGKTVRVQRVHHVCSGSTTCAAGPPRVQRVHHVCCAQRAGC